MQQREILRPQVGQPLTVKLDQGDGVQREGKYGIDYQYTVNDDAGVMYIPPAGRDALLRAGAQAGDLVEITKTKHGKDYAFSALVCSDAAEPAPTPIRQAAPIPQRAYFDPRLAPAPAPARNGSNGNGHQANGNGSNGTYSTNGHTNGHAGRLAMCLRAAIDATLNAEEYAKTKGMKLEFDEEDVRAMGVSLFINSAKEYNR